ncbi:MAG: hypothetical protein ACK5F5_11740 [Gammaproteobacteria bacterium]|jgi:hypothetical protein
MPWRLPSTLVLPFLGYCVGFAAGASMRKEATSITLIDDPAR